MKKHDIIIGIDPDTVKSGVAVLERKTKKIVTHNLTFPQLVDFLKERKPFSPDYIVVIEAGWLNKISNFHTGVSKIGQHISKNVGSNHQTGKHIAEMAEHFGFEVELKRPLIKYWKGKEGKITHEELKYFTEIDFPTNPETRDAILIAWDKANFPVRVKPI